MSYLNNYLFNIMAVIVTSSFKRDIKRRYLELVEKQKLQSSHPFGMLCTYRLKSKGSL